MFLWLILALYCIGILGCSNAPPNIFQLPRSEGRNDIGFSADGRIPLLFKNKTYRSYQDPVLWERSDGKKVSPEVYNLIDMFTITGYGSHEDIVYGIYMSTLYPGIYLGYNTKFISISGFISGSVPGEKYFPGLQLYSDYELFYASYSIYSQNLGSSVPNPGMGEEGPYRKVLAERYNIGIKPIRTKDELGIGLYLDRSYWKRIFSTGIEVVVSHGL
jgi:hypothetical protein